MMDFGGSLLSITRNAKSVEKVWGTEYWVVNNEDYCFKILKINPGFQCSMHLHRIKTEDFIVFDGTIKLEFEGVGRTMTPGDRVHIPPCSSHRFSSRFGAIVLEISTHHEDDDVQRTEESRKME